MAYEGFKAVEKSVANNPKVKNPGAVAASIGRKKYGKKAFQKAAATGTKMKNTKPLSKAERVSKGAEMMEGE